ncbi:MAG: hypothetical protein LBF94_00540, partial [Puniceicoccales bacterium]|nr:hypothetical protein [Puniceicoccales bacterium]
FFANFLRFCSSTQVESVLKLEKGIILPRVTKKFEIVVSLCTVTKIFDELESISLRFTKFV